jgi:hypothetical protein
VSRLYAVFTVLAQHKIRAGSGYIRIAEVYSYMSNRIYFAGAILLALCAGFIAAQQTVPIQPKVPVVTQSPAGHLHDPKPVVILTADQRIALLEQAAQTLQQQVTALQAQLTAASNNAFNQEGRRESHLRFILDGSGQRCPRPYADWNACRSPAL